MAASGKFDLSNSPDRPSYSSGPRGPYSGTSLDRTGSFRERLESPILSSSSLSSMSRNSSAVAQGDIRSFFQCLRFYPKSLAADHKFHRRGELRRILSVSLGIYQDNSPSVSIKGRLLSSLSPEDFKKTKAGLRVCTTEARERCKVFSDALSVFNKFFPTIPSRKRSRSDVISGDQDTAISLGDRSVLGSSVSKMGLLSHPTTNSLEAEQQRSEERVNNTIKNKRTRTSLLDTRANSLVRLSTRVDNNKEVVRSAKRGAPLGEDCRPMGVDGWEKSKMKKKRSGIKPDVSPSKMSVKTVDASRELKQGMQQRLVNDYRSRVNESDTFRMGPGSGAIGTSKLDGALHQSGTGVRSLARGDQEGSAFLSEKKDQPISSDKQRVNLKAVNKTNLQEGHSSSGPTSSLKLVSSARGPRSNSGTFTKSSPPAQRPVFSSDWEIAQCSSKPSTSSVVSNRKRTLSARSSSPPVAHWAGQRPHKISRTARRINFPSIVPTNDESPALDSNSEIGNGDSSAFARCFSSSSPQQAKLKGDCGPLAVLSDSEESAVAEVKPQEKKKVLEKKDERGVQSVDKTSTLFPSPRKNKLIGGEELGDGICRLGRTNRSLVSSSRSLMSKVDNFGKVRTAKQLRASRMALDKAESKVGRPPARKPSDRKAYTRNKHLTVHAAADLLGLDDGQEELLAAAKTVINESTGHADSHWRHMEPAFRFISEADMLFLKQQEEAMPRSCTPPVPASIDGYKSSNLPNKLALVESQRHSGTCLLAAKGTVPFTEQLMLEAVPHDADPLFQRLMAALITNEKDDCSNWGTDEFEVDPSSVGFPVDSEFEFGDLGHKLLGKCHAAMSESSNSCRETAAGELMDEVDEYEEPNLESALMAVQNIGGISGCGPSCNRVVPNSEFIPLMESAEYQYVKMSLHDRLLMEIKSFGICLDKPEIIQTDNEEISQEFRRWVDKSCALGAKKRDLISKVLVSTSNIREFQEREFEQCAMEKLITRAYEKYMACFAGKAKTMRQAALAFVLRTLDRCQKYEATGTSCFSESSFKDMFNAALIRLSDTRSSDTISDNESNRVGCSSSLVLSLIGQLSQNSDIYSLNALVPENFTLVPNMVKEDALSNKVKKREISLDDVGGNAIVTPNDLPTTGGSITSSAKGRSDRDKEGKGHLGSRNGMAKVGRPVGGSTKGDRKPKVKHKQKTAQLSASVNGLLGKISEQPKAPFLSLPKCIENTTNTKEKDEFGLSGDNPVADLSSLQIPEMDVDLGGQGEDLASWLNIDDDGLQDHDFMGLEIPMDDLADVNMML